MKSISEIFGALPAMPGCVVGMNYRNRHLVESLNPRALIAIANDKLATKRAIQPRKISTPGLIAAIQSSYEIEHVYEDLVRQGRPFVVKPSRSSQGRGVCLFRSASQDRATLLDGRHVSKEDFVFMMQQILQGEYSFGRPQDGILVEELIETDRDWIMAGIPGSPDLRIVLVMGRPILAMARLPSAASEGKANLHCGAVGVGIDLETGRTKGGVCRDVSVDRHPDNDGLLSGLEVQDFDRCLSLARQSYQAVPLGLLGVDLMRDVKKGPVIIELNARPGLAIQVANRSGLLSNGFFQN